MGTVSRAYTEAEDLAEKGRFPDAVRMIDAINKHRETFSEMPFIPILDINDFYNGLDKVKKTLSGPSETTVTARYIRALFAPTTKALEAAKDGMSTSW